MWVCMCIWGPEVNLSYYFSGWLPILFYEARLLTGTWGSLLRLTDWRGSGIFLLWDHLPMNHHAWPLTSVLKVKLGSSASTLWVSCLPRSNHFFLIVSKTGIKDDYYHGDKIKKRFTGFLHCGKRFWYQEQDRKCQTLLLINGYKQNFKTGKYIMCRKKLKKQKTEYNLEQTWTS